MPGARLFFLIAIPQRNVSDFGFQFPDFLGKGNLNG